MSRATLLLLAVLACSAAAQNLANIPALEGWTRAPQRKTMDGQPRHPGKLPGKWLHDSEYWKGKVRLRVHAVQGKTEADVREAEEYYRGTSGLQIPVKDKEIEALGLSLRALAGPPTEMMAGTRPFHMIVNGRRGMTFINISVSGPFKGEDPKQLLKILREVALTVGKRVSP